jgi:phospholipid/cholesterol/gamma-HCH transport system substrate-binding protein
MEFNSNPRVHPLWFTAGMFAIIAIIATVCSALFAGTFRDYVSVTLKSNRSGLVMDAGAAVKMRGVDIGRVAAIKRGTQLSSLQLEIDPDQLRYIPANVQAEIKATTAFGAKFVELTLPDDPSAKRLQAGAVLHSRNVATEVNTVFQNLVGLLRKVDVAKLNSVLTAVSEGVRGQGERIGEATTAASQVLAAVNPRMDTIAANWRSFKGFSDAYGAAAGDIVATLDAASTTSATITAQAKDLEALLLNTAGFSNRAIELLAPNRDNLVNAVNRLEPTTALLLKYNPEYTCTILGAKLLLTNGTYDSVGGNGKSFVQDGGFLTGADLYRYPDNLPIVAAKGGPGGQPGCGSLPDVAKNFPVRYLVTDTGWGTGLDLRPNPGIGHPFWANYLPVTRAVPEPPSIRGEGPPAIGPVPYPGAPPYGAPLYGPDGAPLYPGVPPAPIAPPMPVEPILPAQAQPTPNP